jgi:hypothetical protein
MLRSLKELESYRVSATDGDVGRVATLLLDDHRWIVRYLIVDTGEGVLGRGRRVLISPISFRDADWATHRFHVSLTLDKVKNSPSVDVDKPVSRQHERDYSDHYGLPYYWGYSGIWGMGSYPGMLAASRLDPAPVHASDEPAGDAHLRSAEEVRGYHVQGTDEAIGHVDDFIVDDGTWEIRYLVVDTSNWGFGKKVLVAPHWASRIVWSEKKVYVDLSRRSIKSSPEWNPATAINREYETRLYDYYGRPVYWGGSGSQASQEPRQPPQLSSHPR